MDRGYGPYRGRHRLFEVRPGQPVYRPKVEHPVSGYYMARHDQPQQLSGRLFAGG